MEATRIRVLCLNYSPILREGLGLFIQREPDLELVGASVRGEDSLRLFRRLRPDITVMDLGRPPTNGIDVIRLVRQHDETARIVVLTSTDTDDLRHAALSAGAAAYVHHEILPIELMRLIRDLHARGRPPSADLDAQRPAPRAAHPLLSSREIDVLTLVAQGLRNQEIAEALNITRNTVVVHVRNIFSKLNVHGRIAAVTAATQRGVIGLK